MKLDEAWEYIQGYSVYLVSAFIAIFIDSISAGLSFILHLPAASQINVMSIVNEGTNTTMREEIAFRIVDGQFFFWNISVNELIQLVILLVTLVLTVGKGIIDLIKVIDGWKKRKRAIKNRMRRRNDPE